MDFSLGGLLKNFKAALNSKKSVLGLDIGSSFVKLVQLRKEQERAILKLTAKSPSDLTAK